MKCDQHHVAVQPCGVAAWGRTCKPGEPHQLHKQPGHGCPWKRSRDPWEAGLTRTGVSVAVLGLQVTVQGHSVPGQCWLSHPGAAPSPVSHAAAALATARGKRAAGPALGGSSLRFYKDRERYGSPGCHPEGARRRRRTRDDAHSTLQPAQHVHFLLRHALRLAKWLFTEATRLR